jgi:CRISPR-associated protein Cmr5
MQNLDQIRAAHALSAASGTDKGSVAKLPGMILTNGLLATLAFACEDKDPRKGMKAAADSLAQHLSHPAYALAELATCKTGAALGSKLAGDSLTLQRATTESLAYFSYLKRFATKKADRAAT